MAPRGGVMYRITRLIVVIGFVILAIATNRTEPVASAIYIVGGAWLAFCTKVES